LKFADFHYERQAAIFVI